MFCHSCRTKNTFLHGNENTGQESRYHGCRYCKMLSQFPYELVKTITCDRGSEFANWQTIEEKLDCQVYFIDPYCAWQRGTNENGNGLLREFYLKGRNLSRVSPKTLLRGLALINTRPRKVLSFVPAQDS